MKNEEKYYAREERKEARRFTRMIKNKLALKKNRNKREIK